MNHKKKNAEAIIGTTSFKTWCPVWVTKAFQL